MIKAEVTMTGTISRSAVVRTDKNNNPFLSLLTTVQLKDEKQSTKNIDVFVSYPNGQQSDIALFVEGKRVQLSGTMDIRKKNDQLVFYLTASNLTTDNVNDLDAIAGTMQFRGHLKKENVYEEKKDKNGNAYLVFSAYSAEKVGEEFVSTWVSFMRFPEKDADIESIKPAWMTSKAHVTISGDMQITSYDGALRLACRVKDMNEYVKPNNPQQ